MERRKWKNEQNKNGDATKIGRNFINIVLMKDSVQQLSEGSIDSYRISYTMWQGTQKEKKQFYIQTQREDCVCK